MASDTFKITFSGLVLFVLFTTLILTVAIDFGADHGKTASDIGGGSFNLTVFENTANTVEGNASAFRTSFEGGNIEDVEDATGVFGTLKKFINLMTSPFKLLGHVLTNVLGVPDIFTKIILGILSIILILAIWSVLRKGD
jgi:hypothetical protein